MSNKLNSSFNASSNDVFPAVNTGSSTSLNALTNKLNPQYIIHRISMIFGSLSVLGGAILIGISLAIPTLSAAFPALLPAGIAILIIGLVISLIAGYLYPKVNKYLTTRQVLGMQTKPPLVTIPMIDKASKLDVIKTRLNEVLYSGEGCLNEKSRRSLGMHCISINFNEQDPVVYKINKCPTKNTDQTLSTTKQYYDSALQAKTICSQHNLNSLKIPDILHQAIPSIQPDLFHDVIVEDKLPFSIKKSIQHQIHHEKSHELKTVVKEMVAFIAKTGCTNVDFDTFLINPDNTSEAYLINLDIPKGDISLANIKKGLFGTKTTRGLINCLSSEELLQTALDEITSLGIDIHQDPEIAATIQLKRRQLQVQANIQQIYQNPPKPAQPITIDNLNIDQLTKEAVDVPQEAIALLTRHLKTIIHEPSADIEGINISRIPGQHLILKLDSAPGITFKIMNGNTNPNSLNFIQNYNNSMLDYYKYSLCMNNIIKQENLDLLVSPEVSMLNLNFDNQDTFSVLAYKDPTPTPNYKSSNKYNLYLQSPKKSLSALKQLATLNSKLSSYISSFQTDNIGIIEGAIDNKLLLSHLTPNDNCIHSCFGDRHRSTTGILGYTSSEEEMDLFILESAKLGMIDPAVALKRRVLHSSELDKAATIFSFYEKKNLNQLNDTLNISPDDLSNHLNLDTTLDISEISKTLQQEDEVEYLKSLGKTHLTMREAVQLVIAELNEQLAQQYPKYNNKYPEIFKRLLIVPLVSYEPSNSLILRVFNSLKSDQNGSYEPSWLSQILDALVTLGYVHPSIISDSNFQQSNNGIYSRTLHLFI